MARKTQTREIGRSAITGHFKPIADARRQSATSVVERIKVPAKPVPSKGK